MRLLHVGFKVHDLERTMRAYEAIAGVAWEPISEYDLPGGEAGARQISRVSHGYTEDGVEIEMVQPIAGAAVDDAVLAGREGISHLAFCVDDLDAARDRAAANGFEIVSTGQAPRASWIFLRDERLGGALVQLVQLNKPPSSAR